MSRVVAWFSCGAASACAAKLALADHENVEVVYCNTMASEHPDNVRFFSDVQKWLGVPIRKIASVKYATVDNVFERTRYMAGIKGARCTTEMKKVPRFNYQHADDVHIFGFTAGEGKRMKNFAQNNPELMYDWILGRHHMSKQDCLDDLRSAGIALPMMYSLGFKNNNCLGCVKATSPAYWNAIRMNFPDVFERRAIQSRSLGVRLTRVKGVRVFLDELPIMEAEPITEDVSCGPQCEVVSA